MSPAEDLGTFSKGELCAGIGVVDEEIDDDEIERNGMDEKKKRPVSRSLLYEQIKE